MTTTENTQVTTNQIVTEVWNAVKGEQILASGPNEKAAWRLIGAKNQWQRNELINHGFKVVKA